MMNAKQMWVRTYENEAERYAKVADLYRQPGTNLPIPEGETQRSMIRQSQDLAEYYAQNAEAERTAG
jgi:hypothetical protein